MAAGLTGIEVNGLVFPCDFDSFDRFWQPLTEGQGPAGAYVRGIAADQRTTVRERLRQNIWQSH